MRVLKSTQSGVHSDRDSCRRRACSGTAQYSKAGGNGYIVVASYSAGRWTNHTYSYTGHATGVLKSNTGECFCCCGLPLIQNACRKYMMFSSQGLASASKACQRGHGVGLSSCSVGGDRAAYTMLPDCDGRGFQCDIVL